MIFKQIQDAWNWFVKGGGLTPDSFGNPAANITVSDGVTGGKIQITPTVSGTSTSSVTVAASTHTTDIKMLCVINTQDDIEAAAALKNGYPNVISILPGEVASRRSPSGAITRVSCITLITGATPGEGAMLAASTEATVGVNLRTFAFNASDNVRDINIGLAQNGTPADTQMFVEGFTNG